MNKYIAVISLSLFLFAAGCGEKSNTQPQKKAAPSSEEVSNQEGMLGILSEQIRNLINIEEYDGALFQIEHAENIIKKIPSPSKDAIAFRDGELIYLKGVALAKSGKKKEAGKLFKKCIKLQGDSESVWIKKSRKSLKELNL